MDRTTPYNKEYAQLAKNNGPYSRKLSIMSKKQVALKTALIACLLELALILLGHGDKIFIIISLSGIYLGMKWSQINNHRKKNRT